MNIQQLEYILAVDTYRHFAKAAEHCRVTQPTLSMMIQKLEDELGIKLFDRNLQPVRPTPAGRKVIEQARNVLYQASLIKDIVNEEEQSLKGTFRLAVLPTIAPYLLPRFFQQLSEKHTDLDIRMLEMKTAPTMAALESPHYLPIKVKKDGSIADGVASAEQLGKLGRYVDRLLHQIAREIGSGSIDADPVAHGPQDRACQHCDFAAACGFQEGRGGDRVRYIRSVDPGEFWKFVEEESREEESPCR